LQRYTLADMSAENPSQDLLQTAFATAENEVSAPVDLPHNAVAYVQTTKIEPAGRHTMAEIHANLLTAAQRAQTQIGLIHLAQQLMDKARSPGGSLVNAAQGLQGVSVENLALHSEDAGPEWLGQNRSKVLSLPMGGVLDDVIQNGDSLKLMQLTNRQL